jgi:transcriptional regulator with XRE-family HTH domain
MGLEKKPLEQWMLEKGYTQRSLARKAHERGFKVSDTVINLIVTGKRKNVRADTMGAIAQTLGIEIRQVEEFDAMIEIKLGKETALTTLISSSAGTTTVAGVSPLATAT